MPGLPLPLASARRLHVQWGRALNTVAGEELVVEFKARTTVVSGALHLADGRVLPVTLAEGAGGWRQARVWLPWDITEGQHELRLVNRYEKTVSLQIFLSGALRGQPAPTPRRGLRHPGAEQYGWKSRVRVSSRTTVRVSVARPALRSRTATTRQARRVMHSRLAATSLTRTRSVAQTRAPRLATIAVTGIERTRPEGRGSEVEDLILAGVL